MSQQMFNGLKEAFSELKKEHDILSCKKCKPQFKSQNDLEKCMHVAEVDLVSCE